MKRVAACFVSLALMVFSFLPGVSASAAGWETGISSSAPAAASISGADREAFLNQVLSLVNRERAEKSLAALKRTDALDKIAAVRAKESSVSFSHTRPGGGSPATAFSQFGVSFRLAGENLSYGFSTPGQLVSAWMQSPEHRANLLNGRFSETGLGYFQNSSGTVYCAQLFEQP